MKQNITIKFRVTFQPSWVLARRDSRMLPVDRTVSQIKEKLAGEITRSNLTECEGTLTAKDAASAEKELNALIAEAFGIAPEDSCFTVSVEEQTAAMPEPPKTEAPQEQTAPEAPAAGSKRAFASTAAAAVAGSNAPEAAAPKAQDASAVGQIMEKIRGLIGAAEFKVLAEECVKIAPLLRESDTLDAFTRRCYLFSANAGCGMSEYLQLFAELIEAEGLFQFRKTKAMPGITPPKKVVEIILPAPGVDENAAENFEKFLHNNEGALVCIDISSWMNKADDPTFRDLLRLTEIAAGKTLISFRVPFVEHNVLRNLHKQLNDQLFVRDITIVPFDAAELEQYGRKLLEEKQFTVEDGAWELFRLRMDEEKNDGRFYGFHTVRKTVLEMLYLKQLSDAGRGTPDRLIRRSDITELYSGEMAEEKSAEEMMNELIGMDAIRERMLSIVHQITTSLESETLEAPCIHMRFLGNPGTGKTTVARIIGKLLREKGVLRNGGFVERHSRELCGRYIGETAPKTAAICRDAYGSVLFIDEAYSLYRGDGASRKDYGLEAIDTLIAEMENHRSDMVVIMAGYKDDMETLMDANAGLKSRMPFEIFFPNYSREQLADIYMLMARKSFVCSEEFEKAVRDYFNKLDQTVLDAKDFSNARFVRNLYERTWGKAVLRCQLSGVTCKELKVEDLALALSDQEFQHIMDNHKTKPIGFA